MAGDSTSRNVALAMGRMLNNDQFEHDNGTNSYPKTRSFDITYHGQVVQRINNVWISAHGVPSQDNFANNLDTYAREKTNVPAIADQESPAFIYISAGAWFTHPRLAPKRGNLTEPWDERYSLYKNHLTALDQFIGDNTPDTDPFTAPMDPVDGIGNQILYTPPAGPRYLGNDTDMVIDRSRRADEIIEMRDWLHRTEGNMKIPLMWSISNVVEGQDKIWRDPYKTGFHVKFHVAELRANIIFNLRCNAKLDRMKSYPYSRTCCTDYGAKPLTQLIVVALAVVYLVACIVFEVSDLLANRDASEPRSRLLNMRVGSLVLALLMCYYADRTQMMAKGSKLWQLKDLVTLCILCIAIMLVTIRRSGPSRSLSLATEEANQRFISRDQTDEWKGWLQLFVLVYHWTGADSGSTHVFYRLCMATYLFQIGYDHAFGFLEKNNFSFNRMAATLLRLNMLSCALAYFIDTDYMFYYLSPLLSFWYLVIYATLAIGGNNSDSQAVLVKICISCLVVSFFLLGTPLTRWTFNVLRVVFQVQWSGEQWQQHVTLDMFVVYVGMLIAVLNREMKGTSISDHLGLRVGLVLLSLLAVGHYFQVTSGLPASTYTNWHPYLSVTPILAFAALRNISNRAQNHHSQAMAWLGRCSLEIWILQFHILLAADGEGLLIVDGLFGDGSLLGDRWRTLVIVLPIFFWISHSVANSTAYIVKLIMHASPKDQKLGRPSGWREWCSARGITEPHIRIACILLIMWFLNMMTPAHGPPVAFDGANNITLRDAVKRETPSLVPVHTRI
ncbi:hypothetical protein ACHAQK_004605 [Fusarium lateritium]